MQTLDKGMGYDQPTTVAAKAGGKIRFIAACLAGIVACGVIAVLVALLLVGSGGEPVIQPAPPATSAPTNSSTDEHPEEEGTDAHEQAGATADMWNAHEEFLQAWQEDEPSKRKKALAKTADDTLAGLLEDTRPENIVTANRTRVEVVGAGEYSVEFQVWFEDVPSSSHVIMNADPDAPYGWKASVVEKRGD